MKLKHITAIALALAYIALFALTLTSCATGPNLIVTPEGFIMTSYQAANGQTYTSGVGFGEDGKVNRIVTQWTTPEGVTVMATRYTKSKNTVLKYQNAQGVWVRWTSSSGVAIGAVPAPPPTLMADLDEAGNPLPPLPEWSERRNSPPVRRSLDMDESGNPLDPAK